MVRHVLFLFLLSFLFFQNCANRSTTDGHAQAGDTTTPATAFQAEEHASDSASATGIDSAGTANEAPSFTPGGILPAPDSMRALYVNRWAAMGKKWKHFIDLAKTTEVNALVIDVKDDRGLTLYKSNVPVAQEVNASDGYCMKRETVRAYLDTMQKHGIYAIARIVVVKDPKLATGKPEWAIRSKSDTTKPFRDRKGKMWLDPHHLEVWQYSVDLAREAVEMGFDEIQFDYMRFPDEPGMKVKATFPLANGRTRAQVVREMLDTCGKQIRAMGVRFTGDVFGLTSTAQDDMGIGQLWEQFCDKLDVVLPMAYPSHYARGSYGIKYPNSEPYKTIYHSMKGAIRRSEKVKGAGEIIPWYQDFTLGAPHYGPHEVREQIRAGEELGMKGWVLWNPRSVYNEKAFRPKAKRTTEAKPDSAAVAAQ